MRVLSIRADDTGCGFYRMQEPARVLRKQGMHITEFMNGGIDSEFDENDRIVKIEELDYDVVVMQLPSWQDALDTIPLIQAQGIAVVAEFDDDYWAMGRDHFMKDISDTIRMREACKMADLVTVTTPALARKIGAWTKHEPVVVRNCIPASYLGLNEQNHDGLRVGWSGNPFTHPGDLEVTGREIVKVVRANKAEYITIGNELASTILGFKDKEALIQDWVPLKLYPKALQLMDIGIVPLRSSAFNDAKSYLKGLEYAALGIPFVASSTPEYARIADKKVGLIARSRSDWYRHLDALLKSPYYREEVASLAYGWAVTQSYEVNAHLWGEAWERAIEIRKTAVV